MQVNKLKIDLFESDFQDEDGEEISISSIYIPNEDEYESFSQEDEEDFDLGSLAAEYKGRKVTLNKPFRTPSGPKKFAVYTKNEKGNVVIVRFGDPNMKIKKNIPERRKAFRDRFNCDSPGPKWKSRWWACWAW